MQTARQSLLVLFSQSCHFPFVKYECGQITFHLFDVASPDQHTLLRRWRDDKPAILISPFVRPKRLGFIQNASRLRCGKDESRSVYKVQIPSLTFATGEEKLRIGRNFPIVKHLTPTLRTVPIGVPLKNELLPDSLRV